MIAAQVLLAQSLLGATGASDAAQVNPILAGGGGIEDIAVPVSGYSKKMSAAKGKGTSQGTKGGRGKGSSGQRNPHSSRGASVHQVAGSDEDYYNNVTTEGEDAPDEEGNLGEEGLGDQWEDGDGSWETVQREYEGDYHE